MGEDIGGKWGRVVRNMYKGHIDTDKGGEDEEWEVRMAGEREG